MGVLDSYLCSRKSEALVLLISLSMVERIVKRWNTFQGARERDVNVFFTNILIRSEFLSYKLMYQKSLRHIPTKLTFVTKFSNMTSYLKQGKTGKYDIYGVNTIFMENSK